jgi:hypothetical protein
MSEIGVFSCGNFASTDYPRIDGIYKITAYDPANKYFETAMKCITTGHQTCQFKD